MCALAGKLTMKKPIRTKTVNNLFISIIVLKLNKTQQRSGEKLGKEIANVCHFVGDFERISILRSGDSCAKRKETLGASLVIGNG